MNAGILGAAKAKNRAAFPTQVEPWCPPHDTFDAASGVDYALVKWPAGETAKLR